MLSSPDALPLLLLALLLDAVIGDPDWLWRRLPHPVALIGGLIAAVERHTNAGFSARAQRVNGALLATALIAGGVALGLLIDHGLRLVPGGPWAIAGLASVLLAQRSLARHVAAVAEGLRDSLAAGRRAVAMIVGRDPEQLSEAGVARAAIESNAENFSDGLVAPAFWFAIAGLPGLIAYKALNTADSMIGHKSDRYLHFGRAAARLDDAANWLPARLCGGLIAAAAPFGGGSMRMAFAVMRRDARRLASPNAGYPEAAMAGALDLALAGPRRYAGGVSEAAWINPGRGEAGVADIARSLRVTWAAWGLIVALTAGGAMLTL